METNENVNNEAVETEEIAYEDPINETEDSESEATDESAEKHSGLGLAAGIAIVAVGAAAVAGGKKLINKMKLKRRDKETDAIVAGDEDEKPQYERLTWRERITGKIKVYSDDED